MAALVRHGARRFGGSMMQRTQAAFTSPAVAEERRRIVPRLMHTEQHACARPAAHHKADAMQELQQKKEELYDVLSKADAEKNFMTNWRNRLLLQHLSPHVSPRPYDAQWRFLRVSRVVNNVVKIAGVISCGCMIATGLYGYKRIVAGEEIPAPSVKKQQH